MRSKSKSLLHSLHVKRKVGCAEIRRCSARRYWRGRYLASLAAKAVMTTLLILSAPARASYDTDIVGVITEVVTYNSNGYFFVRLNNQPSSHPACDSSYFAVDAAGNEEARKQLYVRALLAHATQTPVTIGYDGQSNCAVGKIRIYRIG